MRLDDGWADWTSTGSKKRPQSRSAPPRDTRPNLVVASALEVGATAAYSGSGATTLRLERSEAPP
jgi:hypothetical protein